jgi:hypothetical protein
MRIAALSGWTSEQKHAVVPSVTFDGTFLQETSAATGAAASPLRSLR